MCCPGFPGSKKRGGRGAFKYLVSWICPRSFYLISNCSLSMFRCCLACRVWLEHRDKLRVPALLRHSLHLTGHILCRGLGGPGQLHKNKRNTPDPPWKAAANSHLTWTTTPQTPQREIPTFHSDFASLKWIYKVLPKLPWVFVQSLVGKTFCTAQ